MEQEDENLKEAEAEEQADEIFEEFQDIEVEEITSSSNAQQQLQKAVIPTILAVHPASCSLAINTTTKTATLPSSSAMGVIAISNACILDYRKSLILRKALIVDEHAVAAAASVNDSDDEASKQQQQNVVIVNENENDEQNKSKTSCIRRTTSSATNNCEPD